MKRIFATALTLALSATVQAEARDCTPYNGPYGYYGNPWCDADAGNRGAPSPERSNRKPARGCTPYNGPYGYYGNPWCDADAGNRGAPSPKRSNLKPARKATTRMMSADEMSASEWRDCAGHFYFLHQSLHETGGTGKMLTWVAGMAITASNAALIKDVSERGTEEPTELNPQQLMDEYLRKRSTYANDEAYMVAYRDKCRGPTEAFMKRYAEWLKSRQ